MSFQGEVSSNRDLILKHCDFDKYNHGELYSDFGGDLDTQIRDKMTDEVYFKEAHFSEDDVLDFLENLLKKVEKNAS